MKRPGIDAMEKELREYRHEHEVFEIADILDLISYIRHLEKPDMSTVLGYEAGYEAGVLEKEAEIERLKTSISLCSGSCRIPEMEETDE